MTEEPHGRARRHVAGPPCRVDLLPSLRVVREAPADLRTHAHSLGRAPERRVPQAAERGAVGRRLDVGDGVLAVAHGDGDTGEEVHRRLFLEDAVRVTMSSCRLVMYAEQPPGPAPRWGAGELPTGWTSLATVRRDAWDRIGAQRHPEARGSLGSVVIGRITYQFSTA